MARQRIHTPRLPRKTYGLVKWLVLNYTDLVLQRQAILEASPAPPEIATRTNAIKDPTGATVVRLENVSTNIHAIESAIKRISEDVRLPVWKNATIGAPFPDYANIKTWNAYKNDFFFWIAVELGYSLEKPPDEHDQRI